MNIQRVMLGFVVGGLGAVVNAGLTHRPVIPLMMAGAVYGSLFAILAAPRANSTGAGLLWGLAYAFILWLAFPAGIIPLLIGHMPEMGMLDTARGHFPELVSLVLCFGFPLGLALGILGSVDSTLQHHSKIKFSLPRAIVTGGFAGLFGGWAFGKWMAQVNFYPLIAGLVNSGSPMVGVTLH